MSKLYEKILKEEINNLDDGIIEQLYKLYFLSFKNSDYYRNYNNVEWNKISPIITFSLKYVSIGNFEKNKKRFNYILNLIKNKIYGTV